MSEQPVLRCRGLVRTFADGRLRVEVLKGVELSLGAGDTLAIVGASGSGKSTLLHCLGGLDPVTAGEVEITGEALSRLGERQNAPLPRGPIV